MTSIHGSAFSGVPICSSIAITLAGAPPWSGPDSAPTAPAIAEPTSAPDDGYATRRQLLRSPAPAGRRRYILRGRAHAPTQDS